MKAAKPLSRLARALSGIRQSRQNVIGMNLRNRLLVSAENPRHLRYLVDDKLEAKDKLVAAGIATPRTIATCRGLGEVAPLLGRLEGESSFVIKPARAGGGRGVLVVVDKSEKGWVGAGGRVLTHEDLRRHLAEIVFGSFSKKLEDVALVEARVIQHQELSRLSPEGLCDTRILVLRGRALLAMMRIPTRRSSGRANLHAGGIGVAVELQTGRITRSLQDGMPADQHPDTGERLTGLTLPDWKATVETAIRAAQAFPLGYLGVDVALDEQLGPMVLELNARSGLEIQNVCNVGLGELLEGVP